MIKSGDYVTLNNGGGVWLVMGYDKKRKLFEILCNPHGVQFVTGAQIKKI